MSNPIIAQTKIHCGPITTDEGPARRIWIRCGDKKCPRCKPEETEGLRFQVDGDELLSTWEHLSKLKEAGVAWTPEQKNWWQLWGPDQWRCIG